MDKGAWPQKSTRIIVFFSKIEYFFQNAASDISHQHKFYANKRVDDDCKAGQIGTKSAQTRRC